MSEADPLLDREAIEDAFRRLGGRLARRGVIGDVYVFGGAAMALAYDARRATRDIDAVFEPHGIVLEEAQGVAEELGLPRWWLNEQASAYVAPGGDPSAPRVFDHPGLRVAAASPEHLLAMKVLAARRRDGEDLRFLISRLGLTSVDEILALCAEVFPDEDRSRFPPGDRRRTGADLAERASQVIRMRRGGRSAMVEGWRQDPGALHGCARCGGCGPTCARTGRRWPRWPRPRCSGWGPGSSSRS